MEYTAPTIGNKSLNNNDFLRLMWEGYCPENPNYNFNAQKFVTTRTDGLTPSVFFYN